MLIFIALYFNNFNDNYCYPNMELLSSFYSCFLTGPRGLESCYLSFGYECRKIPLKLAACFENYFVRSFPEEK